MEGSFHTTDGNVILTFLISPLLMFRESSPELIDDDDNNNENVLTKVLIWETHEKGFEEDRDGIINPSGINRQVRNI